MSGKTAKESGLNSPGGQDHPEGTKNWDELQRDTGHGSGRNSQNSTASSKRLAISNWKEEYEDLKKDIVRQKLIHETRLRQKDRLPKAIDQYSLVFGEDGESSEEMIEARRQLDILETKEALRRATYARDLQEVNRLLKDIDVKERQGKVDVLEKQQKKRPTVRQEPVTSVPETPELYRTSPNSPRKNIGATSSRKPVVDGRYESQLKLEMLHAKRMVDGLKTEKAAETKKPNLIRTLSEIKGYVKPPRGLHDLMAAVLLLLGEDEDTTKSWKACANFANPLGPQGMANRIFNFNLEDVHPDIAARAKEIIDAADPDGSMIQSVTTGGAQLYIWITGVLDEYSEKKGFGEPANVKRQREIFWQNPQALSSVTKYRGQ